MTILCGTDLSDSAARAAGAAGALARLLGQSLRLVHVMDELGAEVSVDAAHAAQLARRSHVVGELARATAERFGIKVDASVVTGFSDEKLIEEAQACHAHLLVVAARGWKSPARWLLGSVAERVVQASPIPVLVVRDAGCIEAWAAGSRPLRVMVGVEPSSLARDALAWAAGLRKLAPCELHVAQVSPLFEGPMVWSMIFAQPLDHVAMTRDLRAWSGDIAADGETVFSVIPGANRVEQHLVASATAWSADVIVVGTHQRAGVARLWQGSVSRGVLHQATGNVICVPRARSDDELDDVPRFRRVLVTTGPGPAADRAVPVAYGMVEPGGIVHILYCAPPGWMAGNEAAAHRIRELSTLQEKSRRIATEIAISHTTDMASAIAAAAAQHGADAICMTEAPDVAQGGAAPDQGAWDSVVLEVMRRTGLPLVLVPRASSALDAGRGGVHR